MRERQPFLACRSVRCGWHCSGPTLKLPHPPTEPSCCRPHLAGVFAELWHARPAHSLPALPSAPNADLASRQLGGEPARTLADYVQAEGLSVTTATVDVDYSYWPAYDVLQVWEPRDEVQCWRVSGTCPVCLHLPASLQRLHALRMAACCMMPGCARCWVPQLSTHHMPSRAMQRLLPAGVDVPSAFESVGHIAHLNLREELLPYKHIIGQVGAVVPLSTAVEGVSAPFTRGFGTYSTYGFPTGSMRTLGCVSGGPLCLASLAWPTARRAHNSRWWEPQQGAHQLDTFPGSMGWKALL